MAHYCAKAPYNLQKTVFTLTESVVPTVGRNALRRHRLPLAPKLPLVRNCAIDCAIRLQQSQGENCEQREYWLEQIQQS